MTSRMRLSAAKRQRLRRGAATRSNNASDISTLYQQVCSQHDGIADFRAKLLGLLPIASGAGFFLLIGQAGTLSTLLPYLSAVGLFGLAVTIGLFFYELRGIQKCYALIEAAKRLEQKLCQEPTMVSGAFLARPPSKWGIGARNAALIIYPAVAGSWAYIAALGIASLDLTNSMIAAAFGLAPNPLSEAGAASGFASFFGLGSACLLYFLGRDFTKWAQASRAS